MDNDERLLDTLKAAGLEPHRPAFFPVTCPEARPNSKRNLVVHRDGSVTERIMLMVADPSHREQLILQHYLSHCNKLFWKENLGVNIVGRDNPWDFSVELSNDLSFSVEITAICEHELRFRLLKHEERMRRWMYDEHIPLFELIALEYRFPNKDIANMIGDFRGEGLGKKDLVKNPYRADGPLMIIGGFVPDPPPLTDMLEDSISSKESKPHDNKGITTLIIDNRLSTYDAPDVHLAIDALRDRFEDSPFAEIWFYTGYFSDDDGNNAEFCCIPLKTTAERVELLAEAVDELGVDEHGRMIL